MEKFVRWLGSGRDRDLELACERIEDAAAWYCTRAESFALFERIRRVVLDDFFHAVRAGAAEAIEEHAWWLSRAAIADDDIWLAGAALRRVASLDWEVVIREGLHLPDDADLAPELKKADWHLRHPPPAFARAQAASQPPPVPYPYRGAGAPLSIREELHPDLQHPPPARPASQPRAAPYPNRKAVRESFLPAA